MFFSWIIPFLSVRVPFDLKLNEERTACYFFRHLKIYTMLSELLGPHAIFHNPIIYMMWNKLNYLCLVEFELWQIVSFWCCQQYEELTMCMYSFVVVGEISWTGFGTPSSESFWYNWSIHECCGRCVLRP